MSEKSVKFGAVKKIILATFSDSRRLQAQGIPCISSIGKPYDGYLKEFTGYFTVEGVQTNYAMFLQGVRVRDYKAAKMLYLESLDKFGLESLVDTMDNICCAEDTQTIAFLGSGYNTQFCYRYILADYFKNCGAEIVEWEGHKTTPLDESIMEIQNKYWSEDVYQKRGHFNLSDEEVGKTLESMSWVFAKTMASNPHYYTLRKDCGCETKDYLGLVKHIRCFGEMVNYGGFYYRCWDYNGYRYWTMPQDIYDEDCDLINRRKL